MGKGNTPAIAAIRQPFRDARGEGAIVFDAARWPQATPRLLDPTAWEPPAEAVAEGGRGAAWFVQGDFGRGVLRRYRRGGLAARVSADRYLWMGEARVRSIAEFKLLASLRALGLRVPLPLMAGYQRQGLAYRAAIVVERIEGARSLAAFLDEPRAGAWQAAGRAIARLHAAGVDHADLNAHNVLLDGAGEGWLIDFDRGRRRRDAGSWREANLARLSRSLAKLASPGQASWREGFEHLSQAYEQTFHAASARPPVAETGR